MKIGAILYELISIFFFPTMYAGICTNKIRIPINICVQIVVMNNYVIINQKISTPPLFGLTYDHACSSCFSIYQQNATKLTTNKRDKITLTRNASSALENQFTRPYPVTLPGKTKEPISCFLLILKVVNLERRSAFENFHIKIRNFY